MSAANLRWWSIHHLRCNTWQDLKSQFPLWMEVAHVWALKMEEAEGNTRLSPRSVLSGLPESQAWWKPSHCNIPQEVRRAGSIHTYMLNLTQNQSPGLDTRFLDAGAEKSGVLLEE